MIKNRQKFNYYSDYRSLIDKLDSNLDSRLTKLNTLLEKITKWASLHRISLRSIPRNIEGLMSLETLDFSNCGLTSLPDWIGEIPTLRQLNLSNNQLTELPNSICNLSELTHLHINNNKITSLPINFNQLSKLTNKQAILGELKRYKDAVALAEQQEKSRLAKLKAEKEKSDRIAREQAKQKKIEEERKIQAKLKAQRERKERLARIEAEKLEAERKKKLKRNILILKIVGTLVVLLLVVMAIKAMFNYVSNWWNGDDSEYQQQSATTATISGTAEECFYVHSKEAKIRQEIKISDNVISYPEVNDKLCAVELWQPNNGSSFKYPWYKVKVNGGFGWISAVALGKNPRVYADCTGFSMNEIYTVTANSGLNVRSSNSDKSDIIGVIAKGNYVCPTDSSEQWVKTTLKNGDKGWVFKEYLHDVQCYYVGAKKLTIRNKVSLDSNDKTKYLYLHDQVCTLNSAQAPSKSAYSKNWVYIIDGDNDYGWVSSAYLLKDSVDLTNDLPDEKPIAELRRRIESYNSKH